MPPRRHLIARLGHLCTEYFSCRIPRRSLVGVGKSLAGHAASEQHAVFLSIRADTRVAIHGRGHHARHLEARSGKRHQPCRRPWLPSPWFTVLSLLHKHVSQTVPELPAANEPTSGSEGRAPASVDGFVSAAAFSGAKPGFVFKTGPAGLGYYPDAGAGGMR